MKIALIGALSMAVIAVGAAQAVDTIGGSATLPAAAPLTTDTVEDRTETTEDARTGDAGQGRGRGRGRGGDD